MAYSAYAVANAFIQRAKDGELNGLTPMKLQKLLFYTQSWHLKLAEKPLFDDFFARWKFGPVIPSVYHEFKNYGSANIARFATTLSHNDDSFEIYEPTVPESDDDTWNLIDRIIQVYGDYSGSQLSNMTHEAGSAWYETGKGDGGVLLNRDLAKYLVLEQVSTEAEADSLQ